MQKCGNVCYRPIHRTCQSLLVRNSWYSSLAGLTKALPEAIWAAAPTTTRGQPTPLSSDAKGERLVYTSNKSVFVRSIDRPEISKQYTQHTVRATVARFSPSGFYIASGDVSGTVRVWDSIGAENTKGEYHIIAGQINDIAWDGDSQRIIAVGDGKERFGHCITADSGNSVGEISGHSSKINCVSIRQQRPLRAATGSDDKTMCFFHGAPFKFNTSVRGNHENFIYGSQFSPDGTFLVTVGSDKKIWLYDGKTGDTLRQIGEGEHQGSIFGVSWADDSKRFATCSGDQTVKAWEVDSGRCTHTWKFGGDNKGNFLHQQVGVTWPAGRKDDLIISIDLEGNLNYLQMDRESPVRIVRGHQKAISAATLSSKDNLLWTGSADGRMLAWNVGTGAAEVVHGECHSNYIAGLCSSKSNQSVYSAGWDDTLRTIDTDQKSFSKSAIKMGGQPKGIAALSIRDQIFALVVTSTEVIVYSGEAEVARHDVKAPLTCIAAAGDVLAVGGDDKKVRIFKAASHSSLSLLSELTEATSSISALSFSADGSKLAVGQANGKVFAYTSASGQWALTTNRWTAHTARVTCIAWDHEGSKAASGALDTNVFVWSLNDPGKRVKAANAHKEGVAGVAWIDAAKVSSMGADATVKLWAVSG